MEKEGNKIQISQKLEQKRDNSFEEFFGKIVDS